MPSAADERGFGRALILVHASEAVSVIADRHDAPLRNDSDGVMQAEKAAATSAIATDSSDATVPEVPFFPRSAGVFALQTSKVVRRVTWLRGRTLPAAESTLGLRGPTGLVEGASGANLRHAATSNLTNNLTLGSTGPLVGKVGTWVQLGCGDRVFAPKGQCPSECPFFAEIIPKPGETCLFMCVRADDCGTADGLLDPAENIADEHTLVCRSCAVMGCDTCDPGPLDRCARCDSGYTLNGRGQCVTAYRKAWLIFIFVVVLALIVPFAWYVDLRRRPISNPEGLAEGLLFRSRSKLRMPRGETDDDDQGSGRLWPIITNLHHHNVGGPGLLLHFNFQRALLFWGIAGIAIWVVWAYSTDPELLVLGLFPTGTAQQMCAVTQHGRLAQKKIMSSKVGFLVVFYIFTFVGLLVYAYLNGRRCEVMGAESTMRDFAAVLTGLAEEVGSDQLEQELAKAVQEATGETVVGVSISWAYSDNSEAVGKATDQNLRALHADFLKNARGGSSVGRVAAVASAAASLLTGGSGAGGEEGEALPNATRPSGAGVPPYMPVPEQAARRSLWELSCRPAFNRIEGFLGFGPNALQPKTGDRLNEEQIVTLLRAMKTTGMAFVVFHTEASRDAAVAVARERGSNFVVKGKRVELTAVDTEPNTVCWDHCQVSRAKLFWNCCAGVGLVVVALLLWCACFYYPYAKWVSSFHYAHGEEPGFMQALIFSLLVTIGNQIMYFICSTIANNVGFTYKDCAEAFYTGLYTSAAFLNLIGDLTVEWYAGYKALVNSRSHTADGHLISDLVTREEIFESYPMQKILGSRHFAYCFPSCFLLPYLMEPLFAIYVPYHLAKLLLRTDKSVRGWEAQQTMQIFVPMDLSRYGDLLLNVMLATMILFFPPGTMLKLMLVFFLSHAYIYYYDKYRVLRCVPNFWFSTSIVDRFSQAFLAVPCGIILVAAVYKANCMSSQSYCLHSHRLIAACAGALLFHLTLHLSCLEFLVPKLINIDHKATKEPYEHAASRLPCTWFSSNPVHCLRTQYLQGASPPCVFFESGREYLLKANPKIGVYFEDRSSADTDVLEEYKY